MISRVDETPPGVLRALADDAFGGDLAELERALRERLGKEPKIYRLEAKILADLEAVNRMQGEGRKG